MKSLVYLLFFLISLSAFSQQHQIEITNLRNGKVKTFQENQRVKIRTLDRKKIIGNLKLLDSLTFSINNQTVKIDSLQSIKKQPRILATAKTIVLIAGVTVIGASLIAASGGSNSAFLLFSIGSGVTIGAGILEGINGNNSNYKWKFKIIEK